MEYNFDLSPEENLALEISEITKKYTMEELHFEIVNFLFNKKIFFISIVRDKINIMKLETQLNKIGIHKSFTDRSSDSMKKYITIRTC